LTTERFEKLQTVAFEKVPESNSREEIHDQKWNRWFEELKIFYKEIAIQM
jgi:hypothetical protein